MPRPRIFGLLFIALFMLLTVPAGAQTNIMPIRDLREGMKGVGKTVILGTAIQDFDVEIVGILERGGFNGGPMVLVRGSGPVLDATGGFAGGYSGSPVYINGQMIGAISAAWFFADHSIAGVTPIEEMLKNFGYPNESPGNVSGELTPLADALTLEGQSLASLRIANEAPPTIEQVASDAARGVLTLTPCKTPLFVNGLNPELVERINTELGPRMPYLEIMPGLGPSGSGYASADGGAARMDIFANLEPGAAIGAQLVAGDIDLTAIGTLTYVDGNQVLAFGHPFLQVGAVELPLTKARIVHTMKSIQRSFKMGESISLVGTIDQDRSAGISGTLGKSPRMIPFHLTVRDTDLDRVRRYNYDVIDYEAILPFLGLLPPMQGLSEVMDRQGPATIRSHFKILTDKLPPIERTNLFYDQFSGVGFMELVQGLYILTTQNIFEDVEVQEVSIDVEVTQNRQTSDIIKAEIVGDDSHSAPDLNEPADTESSGELTPPPAPPPPAPLQQGMTEVHAYEMPTLGGIDASATPVKVKPGDKVTVEVHLKPYREAAKIERLTLTIPQDMPLGQTTIEVRGGGRLPSIFQMSAEVQGMPPGFMPSRSQPVAQKPPESLRDLVKEFLKSEKMNELVIELYRTGGGNSLLDPEPAEESVRTPKARERAQSEATAGVTNPDADDADEDEAIKSVRHTDRVIFGSVMLPIEIVNEDATSGSAVEKPEKPTEKPTEKPEEQRKPEKQRGGKYGHRP